MAEKVTIARPYARAVFELARDKSELPQWSSMLLDAATVVSHPDFASLLGSPDVTSEQRADIVIEACRDSLSQQGTNFIKVLSQYRRLEILPEILTLFEQQKADYENTVDVSMVSAVPVDEAQKMRVVESLRKRLGRDVRLICEVDESLLGGAVIRARDLVIDGSVRGRLEKLAAQMTQ
ncbi:MAG: F0F1 ATP synthase subunit delta [Pseudomonadota bacterium]